MSIPEIKYCPATLSDGFKTFSSAALRNLFHGRKVSHILPYNAPHIDEEVAEIFRQNRKTLSISGVRIKQSLRLEKNKLRLTKSDELGQYILKPIPHRETIGRVEDLPANEHLTMQIASQVYKLNVAQNAVVFFKNGEPAYLTKRFDIMENSNRIAQEDFATLFGFSAAAHGDAYKYQGSYEGIARVMKKYISAYLVEIEKLYALVIFNYLFSNGAAHLKNFSVQMTRNGDYILSPAYDLLNTRIHIKDDTAMALNDGLFTDEYSTDSFEANGFYAYDDFMDFAERTGVKKARAQKILDLFRTPQKSVQTLIDRSFLSKKAKELYREFYQVRLKALNCSYSKQL